MRPILAFVAAGLALASCSSADHPDQAAGSTSAAERIERCTDRLLGSSRPRTGVLSRDYAKSAYCKPFEELGWVYDDGALSIATLEWTRQEEACASGGSDGETYDDCIVIELPSDPVVLDCALLRHVRRVEVERYIDRLGNRSVECDDGTPLADLGVD